MSFAKTITLWLENLESINLKPRSIGEFQTGNVSAKVRRTAANAIEKTATCDDFFIEILPSGNEVMAELPVKDHQVIKNFDRLTKWPDITSVEIEYADGTNEDYYVLWKDNDQAGEINAYQSHYLSKNGALYIRICNHGDVLDIIDTDEVNDPEYAELFEFYNFD